MQSLTLDQLESRVLEASKKDVIRSVNKIPSIALHSRPSKRDTNKLELKMSCNLAIGQPYVCVIHSSQLFVLKETWDISIG